MANVRKDIRTVEDWLGKDNEIGIDIWKKKYQTNGETFLEWVNRISGGNDEIKEMILQKKFLFAGRIMAGRGIKDGRKTSLSNCYVMQPPEDNLESIFDCASQMARTYSYGGGCGVDVSGLSPKGAVIRNAAKETSGAISFMELYDLTTRIIGQQGRRGALMISMASNHPDIEEFINLKTDLNAATKANLSIRADGEFFKAIEDGKEYKLSYTREATGETISRMVDAKKLFHRMAETNWDFGEPGILFWDNISGWNLLSEDKNFSYAGTNPCVPGYTPILTDKGYVPIIERVGKVTNVWNGYEFSEVVPRVTGHNQKMVMVEFSDGSELPCTLYHKFILKGGDRVEARNLHIGDKLEKHDFPVIEGGNEVDEKAAYTQGFFLGDGSRSSERNRLTIALYGDKVQCKEYLDYNRDIACPSCEGKQILTLPFYPETYNKEFVPELDYNVKARLDWLAGYIDSDGCLNSKEGSVSISSINREVLMKVKFMLNTLGCHASVTDMHEEADRELPTNDGTGEMKTYHCQKSYRLLISAANVERLLKLGLNTHRVKPEPHVNRDAARFVYVTAIRPIEDCETVYCFTEEKNHSGIFNGVMTAQCAEEPLPAGGSCLLGSINLSEFVKNPFTKNAEFDMEAFGDCVMVCVKAMNDVLIEGIPRHPLQMQRDSVSQWRQIGLGIMGYADMLIKMGLRYGSEETLEMSRKIMQRMTAAAILKSVLMAVEDGAYPACDKEAVIKSAFFQAHKNAVNKLMEEYGWQVDDSKDIEEIVKKYGIANSQLLCIAPTGTISTMFGISGGMEPIFATHYKRKTESLHGKDVYYNMYTAIVKELMDKLGIDDVEKLPNYVITAPNIYYKNRIDTQAMFQHYIDASISSTVNVPNAFSVEDVENLYLYAHEKKLKGITLFRDGCKRAGILTSEDNKKKDEDKGERKTVGKKIKLTTGCGSLHMTAWFDADTGDFVEVFLNKGSSGGCNNFMNGLSRALSITSQYDVPFDAILDQLDSTGVCPSYAVRKATKGDTSPGSCCPMAVGKALKKLHEEVLAEINGEKLVEKETAAAKNKAVCPECGEPLAFEGGCNICKNCGWSKCE